MSLAAVGIVDRSGLIQGWPHVIVRTPVKDPAVGGGGRGVTNLAVLVCSPISMVQLNGRVSCDMVPGRGRSGEGMVPSSTHT